MEVRSQQLDVITSIPVAVLEAIIGHHLDGLAVQARLAVEHRERPAAALEAIEEAPRRPLAPASPRERLYDPARLARLKERRRTRRKA